MTGNGEVKALAVKLGIPRWKVTKRAAQIGAYVPRVKEPNWSQLEYEVLSEHSHKSPKIIRQHLLKHGFDRTVPAILLKLTRMKFRKHRDGYSAAGLARRFGIDSHTITDRWIDRKLLKAEMRGTHRTPKQGGDGYWIREKDVREFFIRHISLIDIRKVDKFWMIDVLCPEG